MRTNKVATFISLGSIILSPDNRVFLNTFFNVFTMSAYAVGNQKNRLCETVEPSLCFSVSTTYDYERNLSYKIYSLNIR